MEIGKQILLEENELKPNRYMANVTACFLPAAAIVGILNEIGVFRVHKMTMNLCLCLVVICSIAAQYYGRNSKMSSKGGTKYFLMSLLLLQTLAIVTALTQWAELMLAIPVIVALQYHNKLVMKFTMIGTVCIAVISAPLSVYFGLPQINYYEFLIHSIGFEISTPKPNPEYELWENIFAVFKYISIPRALFITLMGPVAGYITKIASSNINTRAEVTYLSSYDVLTGLLNRRKFEDKIEEYEKECPDKLICIYADADSLHALNNEFGHIAGDKFLQVCAKQMSERFGEWTYRVGGDEFIAFVIDKSTKAIELEINQIGEALAERGYHMSIGISEKSEDMSMDELVRNAEKNMYTAKRDYYTKSGNDRRRW